MPYSYDFLNIYASQFSPGTLHCSNTQMVRYFRRYLFQKCVSVLDITIPEEWPRDFFLYVLYGVGYVCVLDKAEYGVIPQWGSLTGRNVYYQPKQFIVTNPAFNGASETRTIGVDGAVIKLTPDYMGIVDIIDHYSDLMALCVESAMVNINNSKLAFIFGAKNKRIAESYKKMVDRINEGQTAVFVDSDLFNEEGELNITTLQQDLKNVFIAPELLDVLKLLENQFDADVGLPNNPTEKKERLITDEVNANNASTFSKIQLWVDSINKSAEDAKRIFGIDIHAEARSYVAPEEAQQDEEPEQEVSE